MMPDDVDLITARMATDSGHRTSLDDVMEALGISRTALEAEIAAVQHHL